MVKKLWEFKVEIVKEMLDDIFGSKVEDAYYKGLVYANGVLY